MCIIYFRDMQYEEIYETFYIEEGFFGGYPVE